MAYNKSWKSQLKVGIWLIYKTLVGGIPYELYPIASFACYMYMHIMSNYKKGMMVIIFLQLWFELHSLLMNEIFSFIKKL